MGLTDKRVPIMWTIVILSWLGTQLAPDPWGWLGVAVMVVACPLLIFYVWRDW